MYLTSHRFNTLLPGVQKKIILEQPFEKEDRFHRLKKKSIIYSSQIYPRILQKKYYMLIYMFEKVAAKYRLTG